MTENSTGFPKDDQKALFNVFGKWKCMVCEDVRNKIGQSNMPVFSASVGNYGDDTGDVIKPSILVDHKTHLTTLQQCPLI